MTQALHYLDPPELGWRRRKISVTPRRWFVEVMLDRDAYVTNGRNQAAAALPQHVVEAIHRLQAACDDQVWLSGFPGSLFGIDGPSYVQLNVPYRHVDAAIAALKTAELGGDVSGLDGLASELALPIDDWLRPGEHFLRRGSDFDVNSNTFLSFLRGKANKMGLRLNGRPTPGGVWVRPQLSADSRLSRRLFPDRFPDELDRWATPLPEPDVWRPLEERVRETADDTNPVEFFEADVDPQADCPCGCPFGAGIDAATHEARHAQWSLGLRIPRTVTWGPGDIALVTTQSKVLWRRLAEDAARIPKRENHYDLSSWSATYATEDPDHRRVYLLRFRDWVVGYLVAADLSEHRRLGWGTGGMDPATDLTLRPSIELIWVAAVHRRRGLGRKLVEHLAEDVGCTLDELSWSVPFSEHGRGMARSISPDGVWIHA